MAYALRVLIVFAAATAAGELIERFIGAAGDGGETVPVAVRILAYVPALLAALWAAAAAERVQRAFVAGLIWASVAHIGHAIMTSQPDVVFYWTRALLYRSALCVGLVVMFWGTLRRLGRMRGERGGRRSRGEAPDASSRAWALFRRHDARRRDACESDTHPRQG